MHIAPDGRTIEVHFAGELIASSTRAQLVLENGREPVHYIPPEDVRVELFVANGQQSWCPHKGDAHYYDLVVGGRTSESAAWCYPEPVPGAEPIQHGIAFYPDRVDSLTIDGAPVTARNEATSPGR